MLELEPTEEKPHKHDQKNPSGDHHAPKAHARYRPAAITRQTLLA